MRKFSPFKTYRVKTTIQFEYTTNIAEHDDDDKIEAEKEWLKDHYAVVVNAEKLKIIKFEIL